MSTTTDELMRFELSRERLAELAPSIRTDYHGARPWPHAVIQDLFPEDLLDEVVRECQSVDDSAKLVTKARGQYKKETAGALGPVTSHVLAQLDGPAFTDFLIDVIGVEGLTADPTHWMAGMHQTPPGGFTLIHRDFREHGITKAAHRVNALLYLNRDWPESYGGTLELWPSDMTAVGKRVRPLFNTLVVFETHDQTLHGLPDPVACPPGMSRLSLAAYFYTERPREPRVKPHRAVFARRPQDSWRVGLVPPQDWLREYTPRPLQPGLRKLKGRLTRGR